MVKKSFITFLVSVYSLSAWSASCEFLLSAPMFQLTNDLVLGAVNINNFEKIETKRLIFNPWIYLSSDDMDTSHTSIGLNSEGKLYVFRSNHKGVYTAHTAWLLSGSLKIKKFSITNTGHLSATDEEGLVYTVNNDLALNALRKLDYFSITELLFGKSWPDEGFLKEVNESNRLESLNAEIFFKSYTL